MLNPGGPTAKFAVISVCSEDIALDTFVILWHKEADTSLKRIRTSFSLFAASFFIASTKCSTGYLGSHSHINIGLSIRLDDIDTEMDSCLPTHVVGVFSV